ncbi:hypothetical protein BN865_09810c [Campylobacter coli 76339]|nr:hypothetical protein BN865_09810c [Campylobacter coli 76339]
MRAQAIEVIRHYGDFNSVILGNSLLKNTSAKEANKKLKIGMEKFIHAW